MNLNELVDPLIFRKYILKTILENLIPHLHSQICLLCCNLDRKIDGVWIQCDFCNQWVCYRCQSNILKIRRYAYLCTLFRRLDPTITSECTYNTYISSSINSDYS